MHETKRLEANSKFAVSGALMTGNLAEGWSLGAFALDYRDAGFAVRVGSDGTTLASEAGKPFAPWQARPEGPRRPPPPRPPAASTSPPDDALRPLVVAKPNALAGRRAPVL